jgi:hypothetical protein
MSTEVFEFSLRRRVSRQEIVEVVAAHLGLSSDRIGEEDGYWDLSPEDQARSVGISLRWSGQAFQTRVCGVAMLPLSGTRLGDLAASAARGLKTDVLIGDHRDEATHSDQFLLYTAEGKVFEAIDSEEDGDNDVELLKAL